MQIVDRDSGRVNRYRVSALTYLYRFEPFAGVALVAVEIEPVGFKVTPDLEVILHVSGAVEAVLPGDHACADKLIILSVFP